MLDNPNGNVKHPPADDGLDGLQPIGPYLLAAVNALTAYLEDGRSLLESVNRNLDRIATASEQAAAEQAWR